MTGRKAPFALPFAPTRSKSAGLDAVKTTGRQTAFVLNPPRPNPTTCSRHE
jgi:hypothetical protein